MRSNNENMLKLISLQLIIIIFGPSSTTKLPGYSRTITQMLISQSKTNDGTFPPRHAKTYKRGK